MTRTAQPTSSGDIDVAFEPARTGVDARRAVAVNYHFVRSRNGDRFGLRAHEKPERFGQQLARLSREFSFCRVRDLVDPEWDLPASNVVLTFDDGAKDVAAEAAALLERHGATATVFVCVQPYLEGRLLEIHKIEFLRETTGQTHFAVSYPFGFYDDRTKRTMQELGLLAGLTMQRRMIEPEDVRARWSLPRYDVNDCFDRGSNEIDHEVFSNLATGRLRPASRTGIGSMEHRRSAVTWN